MSINVFLTVAEIESAEYNSPETTGRPYLSVRLHDGSTLYLDTDALDLMVSLGKADQERQAQAVGSLGEKMIELLPSFYGQTPVGDTIQIRKPDRDATERAK